VVVEQDRPDRLFHAPNHGRTQAFLSAVLGKRKMQ
jgi:hypothetical protein